METVAVFILFLKVSFTGADIFFADPDNVTVAVGGVAGFKCAFNQNYECANAAWVFSKSGCDKVSFSSVGVCRSPSLIPFVDTNRFSFSFKDNSSRFQISSVQFSDAGMYACWLTDPINKFSNCAHLQVVNPPTPICSTSSNNAVVGDNVSLYCKVPEESMVSTKLTWHTPKIATGNNVDPGSSHTVQLVLKETDNFNKFMCVAGHAQNEGRNCTVTPLQIDMIVTVSFLEFDAQDVKFECVADAVPEATEFDWDVKTGFPNDADQTWVDVRNESRRRFELTSDQLTVFNLTETDDGLQVRCTAHNDIGMSKTSEPVTVLQCPDGRFVTGTITKCNTFGQTSNGALTFPIALTISIFSAFLLVIVIAVIWKKKKYKVTESNSPATPHISSNLDREPTNETSDDRSPNHYSPTDNARVDSETTTVTVPQVEAPVQEVGDTNRPTELQVPDYKSIGEYSTPVSGVQHPLEHAGSSAEEASQPASPDPEKVAPYDSLDSVRIKTNSGSSTRSTRPKVPLKTQLLKSKLTGRVPPTPLSNKAGMPITLPCYTTVGEVGLGGSCHLDKSDMSREVDDLVDTYETVCYPTI